ncbi:hypothetical protein D3C73_1341690 [compost metagenome]
MRLIFEISQRELDLLFGAVFLLRHIVQKRLAQPAVNPRLVEEISDFFIVPGQRKSRAVEQIVFIWRQYGGGMLG